MKIVGIIPSRLTSSRLPEKALIDIHGLPMVVHVLKRAQMAPTLDRVIVATDSDRIRKTVLAHGGEAIITSTDHQTGTDRIAEVVRNLEADIVVNIQGDEPLLNPAHIDAAVQPLIEDDQVNVAVLVTPYHKKKSPSDIKAVLDLKGDILYCSRTDLPSDARREPTRMWKMCFIVPFRRDFLLRYAALEQTPLEKIEYNEYLRILEHGHRIRTVPVEHADISVDTTEDLKEVRQLMKNDQLRQKY
jgi:3-deoxy-manno-octulosonate cytidylyltransferase (CMP-KDO synthetase)